jgi:hypothetical protein
MHMHLLQLLLPLADNHGERFPRLLFDEVERELIQFGGFTAYPRAPASGLWVSPSEQVKQDEMVVYEVMSETLDLAWWKAYRAKLEERFSQDSLVIRATVVELI